MADVMFLPPSFLSLSPLQWEFIQIRKGVYSLKVRHGSASPLPLARD